MLLVRCSAASAFTIGDQDELNYQRISELSDEYTLDPVRLDQLEMHLRDPRHAEPNLRCLPLRGLKKIALTVQVGTLRSEQYDKFPDFNEKLGKPCLLDAFARTARSRFRKLQIEFASDAEADQGDIPKICILAMLAKPDAPRLSSVTLLVRQRLVPTNNPKQRYQMVTFQVERFGKDALNSGKNPLSILTVVLDRFEYYWRLANEADFGKT